MMREIGRIERLQVQLDRLKKGAKPNQRYDPAALRVVPALRLTAKGVVGLADGQELLDVHHADHPYSWHRPSSGVSFNFSSHYRRMQDRFGTHLALGCAGENIIVAADEVFELAGLSRGLIVQASDETTGRLAQIKVARPCAPFSAYALNLESPPPAETVKETLQFLDGGTRGFYCEWEGEPLVIKMGDKVFVET